MTKPQFVRPAKKTANGWLVSWISVDDLFPDTVADVVVQVGTSGWKKSGLSVVGSVEIPEAELAKLRNEATGVTPVYVYFYRVNPPPSTDLDFVGDLKISKPGGEKVVPPITSLSYELTANNLAFIFNAPGHKTSDWDDIGYKFVIKNGIRGSFTTWAEQENYSGRYDLKDPVSEHDYTIDVRAFNGPRDGAHGLLTVTIPSTTGRWNPVDVAVVRKDDIRPVVGPVNLLSWREGRLDAFTQGRDWSVIHIWHQAGHHPLRGWEELTGDKLGGLEFLGASIRSDELIDVFARNDRGALLHTWYDRGEWGRWERVAGEIWDKATFTAASANPDRIDFLSSSGTGIRWYFWNGKGEGKWSADSQKMPLAHLNTKRITLAPHHSDAYMVFYVGQDNHLWAGKLATSGAFDPGTPIAVAGLEPLSSVDGPSPSAVRRYALGGGGAPPLSVYDVFVSGSQGTVHRVTYTEGEKAAWNVGIPVLDPAALSVTSWDRIQRFDVITTDKKGVVRHYWSDDAMKSVHGPEEL